MTHRSAAAALVLVLGLAGCSAGGHRAAAARPSSAGRSGTAPAPTHGSGPTPTRPLRVVVRRAGWSLPAARSREVVVASGGGLFVAGGLSSARISTGTVWLLDPGSGRVRSTGRLATAVHDAAGFTLDGASYVVAGGGSTTVAAVQRLAPHASATVVGRLPQPRSDLSATVARGTAFVLGGFDGVRSLAAVLATRDGRHFAAVARLARTVRYAAVVAVGDRIEVFGGEHDGVTTSAVQQVDPTTGTVRVVGHLPKPLAHEAAFVVGGEVLLAGGRSHERLQRTLWRWDPATGRAVPVGRLPYAVADAGSAVVGGVGYLVGGEAPDPVASVVTVAVR